MILGSPLAAWAAPPAPLTTLQAVHALTNAEASKNLPVAFEATVTYFRGYETNLFVQDGDTAIYVQSPTDVKLVPGDRVLVRGKTKPSFNPIVVGESIKLLRHGDRPKPEPATFDLMIRAQTDCKLVAVRGVIRTADLATSLVAPLRHLNLQLLTDGGYFNANVDNDDPGALEGLLDSEVEITGVASEEFDSKMHETGVLMHVQSLSDIRILSRAQYDPWSLPITPMDRVITVSHLQDSTPRVRVHGTITYYQPGSAVVLQDGEKSIWIQTLTYKPLRIGDEADATGFPDAHEGFINLVHGEIRDTLIHTPVTPLPATWETLTPKGYDTPGHHYDLVSIEGQIVTEVHEASQDEYVLAVDGKKFSAIFRHPDGPVPNAREIALGSRVRVTGICVLEYSNPFIAQVPFNILLRSFDDIEIVKQPSLLNVRNLVIIVGLLLIVVAIVGAWGWVLERRVRQKTSALAISIEAEAATERRLALLEQKRSRILEDINGSKQLSNILEMIADMVSLKLDYAPCWCELADGAKLGNCPPEMDGLRIVSVKIAARSGPPLGSLLAALAPDTQPSSRETEALGNGARLATLAIETRRLYSDLRRRSEFDLLTDIYNRFSLHKRLDVMIEDARQNSSIFGLIYIDLDRFKPINDTYGHHVGDLFLQEVAKRMSSQLLGGDMMARLGGDEFAALVSLHNGRFDLDRIVARLEHCFADPFVVEEHVLMGSASIGVAVYPEDGTTKDNLLNAADAAMYAVKNKRHEMEKSMAESHQHAL
jgi:diguanylate cyclase (GGDEF)-like protein